MSLNTKLFGLFDVQNGKKIEILGNHDFEIPLKHVHQIVTTNNVFINTSPTDEFFSIDFDIMSSSNWTSLFPK